MRTVPKWVAGDKRLDEYRQLPLDQAFSRIIQVWQSASALRRGPGPFGTVGIPIESQLADWLARERPESEPLLYEHLRHDDELVRAYCVHTLLIIGSRLLLNLPETICGCRTPITRCHGCSVVSLPLCELFEGELGDNRDMFEGANSDRPSGWWL